MNPASATTAASGCATPRIQHLLLAAGQEPPEGILFAIGFGAGALPGPHGVRVPLEPLAGEGLVEIWHASGPVTIGECGAIRFSSDDHFLAGVIEVPERDHGDIAEATAFAYRAIAGFQARSVHPHLLRTWNYLDAINLGAGEHERYRAFCAGRVAGLGRPGHAQHPAATVIGRRDGERVLQVYWLAGREPGVALENPRQVSAYLYPRQYGETPPTF
jgi:chorismate lyase/3-hydroxybenzoate synthase